MRTSEVCVLVRDSVWQDSQLTARWVRWLYSARASQGSPLGYRSAMRPTFGRLATWPTWPYTHLRSNRYASESLTTRLNHAAALGATVSSLSRGRRTIP